MFKSVKHHFSKTTLADLNLRKENEFIYLDSEITHSRVYGLEHEGYFYPSPQKARSIGELLRSDRNWVGQQYSDILNYLIYTINLTQIYLRRSEDDSGNLELVTDPSSFLAAKVQIKEMCKLMLEAEKYFGINCSSYYSGIHITANGVNFGQTWIERKKTLLKVLQFIFENNDHFQKITGRLDGAQKQSDLIYMSDDILGNKDYNERRALFMRYARYLIENWENGSSVNQLGVRVNNNGRGLVEFRWFGSTSNWEKFTEYIEFIDSIILFCNSLDEFEEPTLPEYAMYLERTDYSIILSSIRKILSE